MCRAVLQKIHSFLMISWICDANLQQIRFFVAILRSTFNDLLNMTRKFSSKYDFFAATLRSTFNDLLNMTRNSPANMISLQQHCVRPSMISWICDAILQQIQFFAVTFNDLLNMWHSSPANMISLQQHCVQLSMISWIWYAILQQT